MPPVSFPLWRKLLLAVKTLWALVKEGWDWLRRKRMGAFRPWRVGVRGRKAASALSATDADRLLQRHRDLKDTEKLAQFAARFGLPESDFFTDAVQIERLMRRLLAENPPWLYVSRVLSGGEQGVDRHSPEFVWREQVTREVQDVTLFIPEDDWRDQPLSSLTLRPTRTLEDIWHARLLDQILPPEILMDRHSRGEILVPVQQDRHQRLEFRPEPRRLEVTVRKPVPVPIESEAGSGRGGQLLYVLLDFSASMRGKGATLAMAVIAATLRANMGQRNTRYLFRRYAAAEDLFPRLVEPPLQARTVAEKDALLDAIFATNFNGTATHVNDALEAATADIENLRREENLEASILLVTDGRAEILESTRLRIRAAGIKIHAVMVTPERNPGLESLSESVTNLDIHPDQIQDRPVAMPAAPRPAPRAYRL